MSVREGYKQTEIGVIPEEWSPIKLKDILTVKYGKSQKEVEDANGQYPILGTGGLMGYTKEFLWDKPSVLIGRKGTIDRPQYMETPFWTVDTLFYTDINLDKALPKYIFYKFQTIQWRSLNEASGVPSLSAPNIHNIRMALPPLPEQQKIAVILTSVDNKLELINERIAKTETLKKGLMQKLLSEGIWHSEFKESEVGRIPKEWEVVRLENVVKKLQSGGTPLSTNQDFYGGDIPFVKIDDITRSGKYLVDTKISITQKGLDNSSAWLVPIDSILYSMYASIGFLSVNKVEVATNQAIMNIIPDSSKITLEFLYQYLLDLKGKIDKFIDQTTQKNLNAKKVKNFKIPLPPLPEQKQIAKILSSTDEKLDTLRTKKVKYERLKKGLMQKLLTGEVRVEV